MKFDINEFIAGIRENEEVSNERLYDQEIEETFDNIKEINRSINIFTEEIRELSHKRKEESEKYLLLITNRDEILNKTKGDNNEIKN